MCAIIDIPATATWIHIYFADR